MGDGWGDVAIRMEAWRQKSNNEEPRSEVMSTWTMYVVAARAVKREQS